MKWDSSETQCLAVFFIIACCFWMVFFVVLVLLYMNACDICMRSSTSDLAVDYMTQCARIAETLSGLKKYCCDYQRIQSTGGRFCQVRSVRVAVSCTSAHPCCCLHTACLLVSSSCRDPLFAYSYKSSVMELTTTVLSLLNCCRLKLLAFHFFFFFFFLRSTLVDKYETYL